MEGLVYTMYIQMENKCKVYTDRPTLLLLYKIDEKVIAYAVHIIEDNADKVTRCISH